MNRDNWLAQKIIDYQRNNPDSKIVTIRLAERLQEYLDDCEYELQQKIFYDKWIAEHVLEELSEFSQEDYDRIRDEINRQ